MISVELARRLRNAGLRWTPGSGDRFAVLQPELAQEVFTVSEMVADVHQLPGGPPVIGFNGTVEWALDSIDMDGTVWLPSETQLRELLGATFQRLTREGERWQVVIEVSGREVTVEDADADEAYGRALLHLISGD